MLLLMPIMDRLRRITKKITSAKTKAISSSQTIQQAVDSLTAKRNEIAQNDPQSAALADLDNAIQALNEAKTPRLK